MRNYFISMPVSNIYFCELLITMLCSFNNFSWSTRASHEMIAIMRDYMLDIDQQKFSCDSVLFLVINKPSSAHASLLKHWKVNPFKVFNNSLSHREQCQCLNKLCEHFETVDFTYTYLWVGANGRPPDQYSSSLSKSPAAL